MCGNQKSNWKPAKVWKKESTTNHNTVEGWTTVTNKHTSTNQSKVKQDTDINDRTELKTTIREEMETRSSIDKYEESNKIYTTQNVARTITIVENS